MRAQTCITCEMYNPHTTQPAHPCVLDNGVVRCSSYRPSSAYIEGQLEGRLAALGEAREICENIAKKWAEEEAETTIPENAVTYRRQKNTVLDCSDAIHRLRIVGTL